METIKKIELAGESLEALRRALIGVKSQREEAFLYYSLRFQRLISQ